MYGYATGTLEEQSQLLIAEDVSLYCINGRLINVHKDMLSTTLVQVSISAEKYGARFRIGTSSLNLEPFCLSHEISFTSPRIRSVEFLDRILTKM